MSGVRVGMEGCDPLRRGMWIPVVRAESCESRWFRRREEKGVWVWEVERDIDLGYLPPRPHENRHKEVPMKEQEMRDRVRGTRLIEVVC